MHIKHAPSFFIQNGLWIGPFSAISTCIIYRIECVLANYTNMNNENECSETELRNVDDIAMSGTARLELEIKNLRSADQDLTTSNNEQALQINKLRYVSNHLSAEGI